MPLGTAPPCAIQIQHPSESSGDALPEELAKEKDPAVTILPDDDKVKVQLKMTKQLKALKKAVDALLDVQSNVSGCLRGMTSESQRFDNMLAKVDGIWKKK